MLSGYIDNALSDSDRELVCKRLENDAAFAARLEALRQNDVMLRAAYDQPLQQPIPNRLLALVLRLVSKDLLLKKISAITSMMVNHWQ